MSEDQQQGAAPTLPACPPHVADEFFALDETERSHAVYRAAGQIMAAGWRWKKGEWILPDAPATTAGQQGEARPAREDTDGPLHTALRIFDWLERRSIYRDDNGIKEAHEKIRAALATQAAPEAPPLSSAAPDNNAPAPMALSSGDTLRALLRRARASVRAYRGERSMRGADTVDEDALLAKLDALKLDRAADGGAK